MRIYVKVTARARRNSVEKIAHQEYRVRTTAVPERNKANHAVIALLAEHFRVPKQAVTIVGGATTSRKMIDIDL